MCLIRHDCRLVATCATGLAAIDRLLIAAPEILDRHFSLRPLVVADDRHERHVAAGRVLELLPELVGLRIHIDAKAGRAQFAGERQRVGARLDRSTA